MYHRPLACILPVPFFEVYEFGRLYVPELPRVVPPTPQGKGWRFKEKGDFSV